MTFLLSQQTKDKSWLADLFRIYAFSFIFYYSVLFSFSLLEFIRWICYIARVADSQLYATFESEVYDCIVMQNI